MSFDAFWPVFLAVALLIGVAVLAMAIGVIFRRPCLRGSCGGEAVRSPDGEPVSCDNCPRRAAKLV
jgi:hypothetical protein